MAAFIAPLIGGLAGLFGGGKQKTVNSSGQGSQWGNTSNQTFGTTSGSTTPNLSPLQQKLADLFGSGSQNLYNQAENLSGYTTAGQEGILQQGNLANKATNNMLASRGLSYSPAAANALTSQTQASQAQNQQFLQQIPLLQRQLQQQSLGGLEAAFSALPTGVSTEGTTTGSNNTQTQGGNQFTGTQTQTGDPLAGLFSGLGAGLFGPYGGGGGGSNLGAILRMFGGGNPASSQYGPIIGGTGVGGT